MDAITTTKSRAITFAFLLQQYPKFKPVALALQRDRNLLFALKQALLEIYLREGSVIHLPKGG